MFDDCFVCKQVSFSNNINLYSWLAGSRVPESDPPWVQDHEVQVRSLRRLSYYVTLIRLQKIQFRMNGCLAAESRENYVGSTMTVDSARFVGATSFWLR